MAEKRTGRQYKELKESVKALFDEAGGVVKQATHTASSAPEKRKTSRKVMEKTPEDHHIITLSKAGYKTLEKERQRTGEKMATILERIIQSTVPSDPERESLSTTKEQKSPDPLTTVSQDYEFHVLNRLFSMKENDRLSFDDIADRFNKEGVKTLSGKGKWHGITISSMYDRVKNR